MTDKPTISSLFAEASRLLSAEFENIRRTSVHSGAAGTDAEEALTRFLNAHVPTRWRATRAVLMDYNEATSREVDVAIFDQSSSAAYRTGSLSILPNDGTAIAIEVKSSLDANELRDSYEKIESCKRLAKAPLSADDRRTTEHADLASTATMGIVFAYSSGRSLEAIARQMVELNREKDSHLWPDLVVVLDKGIISYGCQFVGDGQTAGFVGALSKTFSAHPMRVYMTVHAEPALALHRFMLKVLAHLSVYPFRLSLPPFSKMLRGAPGQVQVTASYQFGTDRLLHSDPKGQVGPNPPSAMIELLSDGAVFMELEYFEWQDGGILRSVAGMPFAVLLPQLLQAGCWDGVSSSPSGMVQLSSVMHLKLDEFLALPDRLKGIGIDARVSKRTAG